MNRVTFLDPMSVGCLFVLILVAAMAAFGIRAVRTLDEGLNTASTVSQVSADELK